MTTLASKTKKVSMVRSKKGLRSKSEILLRNLVVIGLLAYFTVFLIIPIIIAFVGSFNQWNPLKGEFNYIGLENYITMFSSGLFWKSIANTFIFSAIVIIFRVALGLGIALAIYSKFVKNKTFFRTIFYMPVVTPLVAVAYVWTFMYNPQIGLVNSTLGTNINWLFDAKYALGSVMMMTIWKDFGYAVVLYIAGLCSLPSDCFEASSIDGANGWQTFRHITLPLLKPTTLFVVVTSLISYLQTYVPIMVMTQGGPGTETYLSSYIIFEEAFVKYNFGYASAMSFVLFILIGLLTMLSFKITNSES